MHWKESAKDEVSVHLSNPSLFRRQRPICRRQSGDVKNDDGDDEMSVHFDVVTSSLSRRFNLEKNLNV
jgi:hypothetical protein